MPACPQCGRDFVAESETQAVCPACAQEAASQPGAAVGAARSARHGPSFAVTKWLIGINVAMFAVMVVWGHVSWTAPTPDQLEHWGANFGPLTLSGEWWRLLSNTFIHIGILHLVLNMWCLWNVGALAENLFGETLYTFIYLCSGVAGSLASLAWHPGVSSAGASGAIFGIAGALIVTLKFAHLSAPRTVVAPILRSLVVFAFYNLAYGAVKSGVDNAAHLGGLLAGVVAAAVVIRRTFRGPEAAGRRRAAALAAVLVLAAAAAGVAHLNGFIAHLYAGELALQRNQPDRAIPELRRVVEQKPNFSEAHVLLGKAYLQKNDLKSAQARLLRGVELDPNNADAWSTLGRVYLQTGRVPEAADAFQRTATLAPHSPQAHFDLGTTLLALRRPQPALAAFKRAVELNPDFTAAYFQMGLIAMGTRDYDTALRAFQEVARLAPQSAEAQFALAAAYQAKGMQKEAAAALAAAMKLRKAAGAPAPNPPAPAPAK